MSLEDLNQFKDDQAKRHDFRFLANLFLIIIGLNLSYFAEPTPKKILPSDTKQEINNSEPNLKSRILDDYRLIKRLSADKVRGIFGTPDFLRGEGNFLMWQYISDECVLELYWEETKQNELISRHVILRDVKANTKKCIQSLY